ncbi:MAG: hypothetical protein R3B06_16400 [Kofleriaceae bacterium]
MGADRARAVAVAVAAAVAAGAGCRDKPAPAPAPTLLPDGCVAALAAAAAGPGAARAAAILAGCPVCGPSFEPLVDAAAGHVDLLATAALIDACPAACGKQAVGRWRTAMADSEPGIPENAGWRALAEACRAPLATPPELRRFASAPWFGLAMIGARLAAVDDQLPPDARAALDQARAALVVPLPAWSASATGMLVPTGATAPGLPWRAVTVFDRALMVGRLPVARFTADGLVLELAAPGYPGDATPAPAAALAALTAPTGPGLVDDVLVVAPKAAPAARALAALASLGDGPARLAVTAEGALWRGVLAPHALAWHPAVGPRVRIDLAAARVAAIAADGTVVASFALPATPLLARLAPVFRATAGHPLELVAVPDDVDVTALVALADAAAAAGITHLAVAAATSAGAGERGAVDAAALQAALASR